LVLDWQSVGGVAGPLLDDDFADGPPTAHGAASPLSEELVRLLDASHYDLLVLLSDGRVTAGPGLEALATQLRASGTDLAILPVGGEGIDARILIDQIVVNPAAALGEREPVTVRASVRGLGDGPVTIRVWVDGAKTDEIQADVPIGEPGALLALEQRLEATFAKEGAATVRVDVEQGALKDSREMTVQVSQRKLQVLILDHRPRYEIRYLREALKRDHTIELSAWLCDGKRWRAWTSGGPTDHLPLTAAELRDYDAIVIGDIAPDTLTNEQMRNIVEAVKRRGTGLLWLPGELGATAGFAKTELGQLIPTRLPDADRLAHGYLDNAAHRLRRTPAAEKNLLFESGAVPWDQLPPQLGAGDLGEPVPGAEVLMEDQDGKPMAVYKTYGVGGSGRGVILAVDDTWRWRRNVGDAYLQRFHGQLLRFVGRRSGARPWRIGVEPRRAIPGEVVKLSLTPLTAEAGEAAPDSATAILVGPGKREMLVHLLPDGGGFSARVPAPDAGQWRIGVADGPNPGDVEDGELDVFPPSSEVREPRADRPALEALARAAGGRLFPDAAALAAALPDIRKDRVETLPPRGLWDNAWAFAAIAVLLAIEWSLRRSYRLP
ncbi:MAG: hypothetical protein H0W72_00445, partial [Planctomycetes bacterium]|nr:hypothetical protein [Planctomycetota bacterium]